MKAVEHFEGYSAHYKYITEILLKVALNTINPKPIMNVIKGHHSSLACSSCAE